MPAAVNTASKESVNCPARSLIRNLTEAARWPGSVRKLRAAGVVHEPPGVRGDAGQVSAAGAVLDNDQGMIRRSSTVSTGTKPAARMPRPCAVSNCLHAGPVRRGAGSIRASGRICHTVDAAIRWPSLMSSALHAPVAPGGIVRGDADHELADRGCRGRPSGTPSARIVPFTCDQPPVPGQQRRRSHREHLSPAMPGDQPGQCREPQPVARLVADPADLAAQHRVLVPEHQQFGVLGHLTPGQHRHRGEQAAHKEADA